VMNRRPLLQRVPVLQLTPTSRQAARRCWRTHPSKVGPTRVDKPSRRLWLMALARMYMRRSLEEAQKQQEIIHHPTQLATMRALMVTRGAPLRPT
jgi:hypothetical protein